MKKFTTCFMLLVLLLGICIVPINAQTYTKENLLILMYHKLSENPNEWSDWCTSPQNFENDVIYLKEKGYVFMTAGEIASNPPDPNQKTVVLTFDDGYMSDYVYALPILERHNARATFFVLGSRVNYYDYLTVDALKALSASPNAEIGNHSLYLHLNNRFTIRRLHNQATPLYSFKDFAKNKSYLESIIGKPVTSLSYPNGLYSATLEKMLRDRGITNITFSTGGELYAFPTTTIIGRRNRSHFDDITQITN
ncbi:MAG: polysaccharide deacetylase family protein [Clostridia bacterium]|nr:polysaccharide deacetylase family protein [Clostridia bacterium]